MRPGICKLINFWKFFFLNVEKFYLKGLWYRNQILNIFKQTSFFFVIEKKIKKISEKVSKLLHEM